MVQARSVLSSVTCSTRAFTLGLGIVTLFPSSLTAGTAATTVHCPWHEASAKVIDVEMGFDRWLPGPDTFIAVPEEYIRPYERARYALDGTDGAALLYAEMPTLAPMYPGDDEEVGLSRDRQGMILIEPAMVLRDQLAVEVGEEAAARAISDGQTSGLRQEGLPEGLRAVPGALLGQNLIAVEGEEVIFLANCQDGRAPACDARVSGETVTAKVHFRAVHLPEWRAILDRTEQLLECFSNRPAASNP